MGVAAVDDDVALFKMGNELGDKVIYSLAGFDEEDDFAGPLEFCTELFDGEGADNFGSYNEMPQVRLSDTY